MTALPHIDRGDWQTLSDALPDLLAADNPEPTYFDFDSSKIRVFLPGFAKKQGKLTQNGSEITVEAGEQRRNIELPSRWSDRSVTGAKFIDNYLELTIG